MKRTLMLLCLLLVAGCTTIEIPTKNGPIRYSRCFEKVYLRMSDPETGKCIVLYTNDGGSAVVKVIAEGAGTLAPLILAEPQKVK